MHIRLLAILVVLMGVVTSGATQPDSEQIWISIEQLGDFDFTVRTEASRVIRRASAETAVPILLRVARGHKDSYVQFRAAVMLYGFEDSRARAFFEEAFDLSNDRVRAAAYDYFEHKPDPAMVPKLLAALDRETSEFVRPALVRALAAQDESAQVQSRLFRDVDHGEGYFRGAVIEALGDYNAGYAVDALMPIASQGGPLQDDALLALGKIGDDRALGTVRRVQTAASSELQPIVSAAACLMNVDCPSQLPYIIDALGYGAEVDKDGSQVLLRSAATALGALAMREHRDALDALFDVGETATGTARAPIALALGTVALRNPEYVVEMLGERTDPELALLLLRNAFDMLDEDFPEERFYILMRSRYWLSPKDSRAQHVAELAIQILEF